MNYFTGIFQGFYLDIKNTVLSPPCSPPLPILVHELTQATPSNTVEPPMFSASVGTPAAYLIYIFSYPLSTCLLWYFCTKLKRAVNKIENIKKT